MPTVQFKANGVNIGSPVSSPPYQIQWTPPNSGDYSITYEVTSDEGVKKASRPRVISVKSATVTNPEGVPARLADPNPTTKGSLGIGLNGITDYSGNRVFLNLAKQAREYVTSSDSTFNTEEVAKIARDANGWATSLTPTSSASFNQLKLILASNPANMPGGRYVVKWVGNATWSYLGATITESTTNRQVITVPQDNETVWLNFTSIDESNYFRDLIVVAEAQEALLTSGEIFNPDYLAILSKFNTLRFMDAQQTNFSPLVAWSDRASGTYFSYATSKGVPVEILVALCNKLSANGWFNMPHRATDDYVTQFATYVRDNLTASLKAYVEYSNEIWNPIFTQGDWVEQQGIARYATADSNFTKRLNYFGYRSNQVGLLWKSVFSGQLNRIIITLGAQAANTYTASEAFTTPLEGSPTTSIDAIAIAPYFNAGGEAGSPAEPNKSTVAAWTLDNLFTQTNQGGLLSGAYPQGFLAESKNWTTQYKTYCTSINKRLIGYEGGQHFVNYTGIASVFTLFINANRDTRMYTAYLKYLADWKEAGGELLCHFQDAGNWSNSGYWGALENMNQYQAGSAKYNALYNFMIQTPTWWV